MTFAETQKSLISKSRVSSFTVAKKSAAAAESREAAAPFKSPTLRRDDAAPRTPPAGWNEYGNQFSQQDPEFDFQTPDTPDFLQELQEHEANCGAGLLGQPARRGAKPTCHMCHSFTTFAFADAAPTDPSLLTFGSRLETVRDLCSRC